MLPVSDLRLLLEKRVCGVEISYLPCLASGYNSNLTADYMIDLRCQGISVDNDNDPAPKNIPVPKNIPLPQLEEENSWILEGIICTRKSKKLHNTYAAFKNYCDEVMNMTKLELFFILFPVGYLKGTLIPETNNFLKHPIEFGEFI